MAAPGWQLGAGTIPRWTMLLLTALAARAITFGNPLVHGDEAFYYVVADGWLRGAIPYVDIWDRKPIGLFILYLPPAALGLPLGTWAYQALALAATVGTAETIARLAARAGWGPGALPAGVAYILWLNLAGGEGGQSPVFYNLLMAGAAALVMPGGEIGRVRGVAAMALVGTALQIKYTVVFEGMFLGLWLLGAERRRGAGVAALAGRGVLLAGVALVPTALAWGSFAAIGAGEAWAYANVTSIFDRNPDPVAEQVENALTTAAILLPLLALALGAQRAADEPARSRQRFLYAWLAAAVAGFVLFGSWFDHYALPVMVPAATCAAGLFADRERRHIGLAVLALAAVVGQGLLTANRIARGSAGELRALAAAVGRGPGCLWVQSGTTLLYPMTGRPAPTSRIFSSHLTRARERGATGVDQVAEVRAIFARAPAVVVMRGPYRGERTDIRRLTLRALTKDYRLAADLPLGRRTVQVFRRVPRRAPADAGREPG